MMEKPEEGEIMERPEEGQPQQHWDAQRQDFLVTMQSPSSRCETPQVPSPAQSRDGDLPASFRGSMDDSRCPSGRAGGTDQTLLQETEGFPGKELWPVEDVIIKSPKSEQDLLDSENIHLSAKAEGECGEEACFPGLRSVFKLRSWGLLLPPGHRHVISVLILEKLPALPSRE